MEKITFLKEKEVLRYITENGAGKIFSQLTEETQKALMDFFTGKSFKLLTYDTVFKQIFCGSNIKRLGMLVSSILGFEVEILQILSPEGKKFSNQGSNLLMDVIARDKTGRVISVEIQRKPYMFQGQRESCYLAELVLEQHKWYSEQINEYNREVSERIKAAEAEGIHITDRDRREKSEYKKKKFNYGELCPVYTIIILEKSYGEFLKVKDSWKHTGRMTFDTGIQLDYLENVVYLVLDRYKKMGENINTNEEKWMYLLGADTPEKVIKAASISDEFFDIIKDVSGFCSREGGILKMFIEHMHDYDREEEKLMYEKEMEEKLKLIEEKNKLIEEQKSELEIQSNELEKKSQKIEEQSSELEEKSQKIKEQSSELEILRQRIRELEAVRH